MQRQSTSSDNKRRRFQAIDVLRAIIDEPSDDDDGDEESETEDEVIQDICSADEDTVSDAATDLSLATGAGPSTQNIGETEGQAEDSDTEPEGQAEDSDTEPEGQAEDSDTEPEGQAEDSDTEPEGQAEDSDTEPEGQAEDSDTETEGQAEDSDTETEGENAIDLLQVLKVPVNLAGKNKYKWSGSVPLRTRAYHSETR
ncbi:hypothetical protein Bpfe_018708 [Biomphalaria pfeifferi]|uniref:Uncharacterized protein n=1 Tax=Biomphalaria pfeifferi TaxID=112525 RepID=A0AAD8BDI3_BIOPF|nr:hypothetical protein Bpfe_018708 [Biomphalaria pfeifferi]